jgi:small subunit ribosomal protein S9
MISFRVISMMTSSLSGCLVRAITRMPVVIRSVPSLSVASFSTSAGNSSAQDKLAVAKSERQMSSAMKMYLKRKREHDMFISRERAEFDVGKEHLASMMGLEASTLTQEQIDQSIEYLFPSGLAPEAKPVMKPPEEIFPKQKDAEFDLEGRPFHSFFYTLKPNFNQAIFSLRDHIDGVTVFGDRLQRQGKGPDPEQILNASKLADSRWVTHEEVSKLCLETVTETEHKEFMGVLERLVGLPFSYRVKDDIFRWRVKEGISASQQEFIPPQFDERGRAWVEVEGRRKTATATVKLSKPGTGLLEITHRDYPGLVYDITYFFALKDRHQLLFPLQFTKMLGLVDIKVEVGGSGPSSQAGAIRYAMAMGLRSFVDKDVIGDMKLVGLLTQDIRARERKKPGKVSARKSYTWKRR